MSLTGAAITELDRAEIQHELKFVFDACQVRSIGGWLASRCSPDRDFPAGIVSSIYYDTRDWCLLRQKAGSEFLKAKVRLRWYCDPRTREPIGTAFLEVKYKVGGRRVKLRFPTEYEANWLTSIGLDHPELRWIPHRLAREGLACARYLRPSLEIRYRRLRFDEATTGSRVAVDYDIGSPRFNPQMLARRGPTLTNSAVLEVKGRFAELPDVLHQLTALGCRKESFSKYIACYRRITRTIG